MKTHRYLALVALALLAPAATYAIPAWSRGAGASCSACHATPTWQLNATGLDFLKSGHRAEPFTMPDEIDWKTYLSLIWKGRAWYENLDSARTGNANTQKPRTNLEQHSFALYTGGPISERFSYFTEIYLSENTGSTSGGNIVQGEAARKKLAEAFLQYNHPLTEDQETYLAVRAGEILPAILHVFGVGARSAEQRDGSLYGWARTSAGQQWEFTSTDGGGTWTQPGPSRFTAPCSPLSLKNLGTLDAPQWLAVWNDPGAIVQKVAPGETDWTSSSWGRTPLVAAISRDEGATWEQPHVLEADPARGFCYTAIHRVGDAVLLAYCCGGRGTAVLQDLCVRRCLLTPV